MAIPCSASEPGDGRSDVQARALDSRAPSARDRRAIRRRRGYVGQDRAVRAIALGAYRHVARLRRIHLQGAPPRGASRPRRHARSSVPPAAARPSSWRSSSGTSCSLPTVIVDMTGLLGDRLRGAGRVHDPHAPPLRRRHGPRRSPPSAIVCLDEFDKLSSGQNNAVFAGAGHDQGRVRARRAARAAEDAGVHRDARAARVHATPTTRPRRSCARADVGFIACGAFSGLKGSSSAAGREHIGFGRDPLSGGQDRIAVSYTEDEVELARTFMNYGFLPELIGRFQRIVPFCALEPGGARRDPASRVLRAVRERVPAGGPGARRVTTTCSTWWSREPAEGDRRPGPRGGASPATSRTRPSRRARARGQARGAALRGGEMGRHRLTSLPAGYAGQASCSELVRVAGGPGAARAGLRGPRPARRARSPAAWPGHAAEVHVQQFEVALPGGSGGVRQPGRRIPLRAARGSAARSWAPTTTPARSPTANPTPRCAAAHPGRQRRRLGHGRLLCTCCPGCALRATGCWTATCGGVLRRGGPGRHRRHAVLARRRAHGRRATRGLRARARWWSWTWWAAGAWCSTWTGTSLATRRAGG